MIKEIFYEHARNLEILRERARSLECKLNEIEYERAVILADLREIDSELMTEGSNYNDN